MKPDAAERVVLVHDWLTGMRGGEKCLEAACRRWPDAPLFTLLHAPGSVPAVIEGRGPKASVLNRLPRVDRYYRYLLPAMPAAARWPIPPCDLVLSFSHCVAKAAVPPPGVPHVSYCFTPMRYAWHMRESYFRRGKLGRLKAVAVDVLMARLREWDRRTADRVTHFIAISRTVQERIAECYGRESVVIHPPVDTDFYTPSPKQRREDFYLVVSALAPYKRFDLAVEACKRLRRKLVVVGSGQDAEKLKSLAGPTVTFLGWQPDDAIRDHLRRCRALLFPGEEDFGIVPVEAQACGTPVIAFGRGGSRDTIRPLGAPDPTGVFFDEQTVEGMIDGIERFEKHGGAFDPQTARRNAVRFRKERYEDELFGYIGQVMRGEPNTVRKAA